MSEKLNKVVATVKQLIEKQNEERKLLGEIICTVAYKEEGPFTIDEWERRKHELLSQAGLRPSPIPFRIRGVPKRFRKPTVQDLGDPASTPPEVTNETHS